MKMPDDFGCLVFDENVMKKRLPNRVYIKFKQAIYEGFALNEQMCNIVAHEMKTWAIEHGATHFTHWFLPMSGISAEKHESFVSKSENNNVIMNFSGKELIKGEPDASSFPSGELRTTFQARGYTIWDNTSPAFIKDNTLCIPAIFCSYHGESLDNKIPLLRSMELINKHALRILRLFGDNFIKRVIPSVGAEQEYFLVDKKICEKRIDLNSCKRTLFGTDSRKYQNIENHYFNPIKNRISNYMKDLDEQLWKLGILAKTKHNEVAPAQHELAPVFTSANIASDQNQLIMEIMKTVAERHGLCCLLHEKPFYGVNGSGKHINWSLMTDTGVNLFEPGENPSKNTPFLLFLCALIKGVNEYQDLFRASVSSAENDLRLGSNEAPSSIVSLSLGDELSDILNSIENGSKYEEKLHTDLDLGICALPKFQKDITDRNRTSPLAFSENKFEFRMAGSSTSIAFPTTVLNTVVATELCQFADELEHCTNFENAVNKIICKTVKSHKRIIFNGDNYSDEWLNEAQNRGLCCFKTAADALPQLITKKNIELFERHKICTETEITARYNFLMQNYCHIFFTEINTMIDMAKRQIIPAVIEYIKKLSETALAKMQVRNNSCNVESQLIDLLSVLSSDLYNTIRLLECTSEKTQQISSLAELANLYNYEARPLMEKIKNIFEKLEQNIDKKLWPFPSYSEIWAST